MTERLDSPFRESGRFRARAAMVLASMFGLRWSAVIALVLAGCPGPDDDELVCPTSAAVVTLSLGLQREVFDADCKTCHNAQDLSSGDFSTIEKTREWTVNRKSQFAGTGALKVVDPKNLANSILWLKVLGGDATGKKGPGGEKVYGAMPLGSGLTAAKKASLKNWICSGAQ